MRVMCEEMFAPVVSVIPFDWLDEAVRQVNGVPFGLAAGIFTQRHQSRDVRRPRACTSGIVHVNEPSSSRVDLMPFAGVKDSGLGREGPKYAMQEMTEERLITLSLENTSMMTGAMFMAECLQQEGVTKVFGQCGHTNYALIDACHKLGIEYVSFRHEQMAAHAADAYFRVSHKLAVLNVHLSPGMTNALTGVVTAAADCTPMVVICRQHAVLPPRARAAPGHPVPRRRVAGGHLPSDLQARVARGRREVPARRDAACAQRRADRASGRGVARHPDGRVLRARRAAGQPITRRAPAELRRTGGDAGGDRRGRGTARRRARPGDLRRQRRDAVRRRRPSCGRSPSRSALRWRRR